MKSNELNMAVSPTKADNLYWLGRYVERVSLTMHILRKSASATDENDVAAALNDFCMRVGIVCAPGAPADILSDLLFSTQNSSSVVNDLEYAKNNAMLLRGDIKSETLAYIEMAVNFMKSAVTDCSGLYSLQFVSDSMMAFWGAVDENVRDSKVRNLLNIGRYVEKLDFLIRFDYDKGRISDVLARLESIDAPELALCDAEALDLIRSRVADSTHKSGDTLARLNSLFAA